MHDYLVLYWLWSSLTTFVCAIQLPDSKYTKTGNVIMCGFLSLGMGWLAWPFSIIGLARAKEKEKNSDHL